MRNFLFILFIAVLISVALYNKSQFQPAELYIITEYDGSYYYAETTAQTEDGTFVPYSYFGKPSKHVVFTEDNVQGSMPSVNDIVMISLDKYGENPLVELY